MARRTVGGICDPGAPRVDAETRRPPGLEEPSSGTTDILDEAELSLQVDNVFDAAVEIEPGYPLPGRRVWIGCRFVIDP